MTGRLGHLQTLDGLNTLVPKAVQFEARRFEAKTCLGTKCEKDSVGNNKPDCTRFFPVTLLGILSDLFRG